MCSTNSSLRFENRFFKSRQHRCSIRISASVCSHWHVFPFNSALHLRRAHSTSVRTHSPRKDCCYLNRTITFPSDPSMTLHARSSDPRTTLDISIELYTVFSGDEDPPPPAPPPPPPPPSRETPPGSLLLPRATRRRLSARFLPRSLCLIAAAATTAGESVGEFNPIPFRVLFYAYKGPQGGRPWRMSSVAQSAATQTKGSENV